MKKLKIFKVNYELYISLYFIQDHMTSCRMLCFGLVPVKLYACCSVVAGLCPSVVVSSVKTNNCWSQQSLFIILEHNEETYYHFLKNKLISNNMCVFAIMNWFIVQA